MKRQAAIFAAAGCATAAILVGTSVSASANPTQAPTSWSCQVGKPNSYSGTAVCHAMPSHQKMRVAIYCYDGVAGTHFYVYGPWVTANNQTSATNCGSFARDNAELIYDSTT